MNKFEHLGFRNNIISYRLLAIGKLHEKWVFEILHIKK